MVISAWPIMGDEEWQLSKDSADVATAYHDNDMWVDRKNLKYRIKHVTKILPTLTK